MLSEREQNQFREVCLEHIWAAVGMHVLYQASGSESDARSAATSVRDLVNAAPAYRECWERVRSTIETQGFHNFIRIVEQEPPTRSPAGIPGRESDTSGTAEMRPRETHRDTVGTTPRNSVKTGCPGLPLAKLRVVSGPFAGRELELTDVITRLGRNGRHVVAIARRSMGYTVVAVDSSESDDYPLINGSRIGRKARALHANDILQVAGIRSRFLPA